jgi:hypothetical protein
MDRNEERQEASAKVKLAATKSVAKKAAPAKPSKVLYVSANEELQPFDIRVRNQKITPYWDKEKEHLIWSVPTDLVDAFDLHEFVVKKRIVKAD